MSAMTGGCLCGAVRFAAEVVASHVHACHCGQCRRWSGGVFLATRAKDGVRFERDDGLKWHQSSTWAERGFCAVCGSALFWRMQDGEGVMVAAGALDDQESLTLAGQVYVDEKPGYFAFANETVDLTGAEVEAKFAGGA